MPPVQTCHAVGSIIAPIVYFSVFVSMLMTKIAVPAHAGLVMSTMDSRAAQLRLLAQA